MTKLGKGEKECPRCHKPIPARALHCKYCKASIPIKGAAKGAKGGAVVAAGIQTIRDMGGLKGLRTALNDYARVVKPIDELGGPEQAEVILKRLEELNSP